MCKQELNMENNNFCFHIQNQNKNQQKKVLMYIITELLLVVEAPGLYLILDSLEECCVQF